MKNSRIMLIGSGGAGKSTLSKQLHQITGVDLFHLDQYYWHPHWVESDKAEWAKVVSELADRDSWIVDGNYGGTMDIRLARANVVIFMNLPRWLCIWRVFKRTIKHYRSSRPDMPPDCPERFSWQFFHYLWNYKKTRVPSILKKLDSLSEEIQVFILHKPKEVKKFITDLENGTIRI